MSPRNAWRGELSAEQRAEILTLASRSAMPDGVVTLRANGKGLAPVDADAMLARAVARERVELELDLLAYEQGRPDSEGKPTRNRNSVRFRDGAMVKLGRTGKGAPFLRDHRQGDSSARGGTVIESSTDKLADGHYQIRQTVRLTEPSAVERALRGLMTSVSVGWNPTGPVVCSLCDVEVLTHQWARECGHLPGERDDDSGAVAEWEYTEAELIETSEVPVPGVPSAGIEGIRAALSAAMTYRGSPPQEIQAMSKLQARVSALLGLAATAGEDETGDAVTTLHAERNALKLQLEAEQRRTAEINARLAHHEAQLAKAAEDAWITEGIKAGKITLGAHEQALRTFFKADADGARALLAAAPTITPVGAQSQSAAAEPQPIATGARALLAASGVNYDKAREYTGMFGAAEPDKALAAYASRVGRS
jgi:hypothetical protein